MLIKSFVSQARGRDDETGSPERRASADPDDIGGGPDPCDELAEQGFIAVAPDLFWRQEPGVDLSVTSEPDWQHGLRLYQAYDRDAGARDVKDTANAVSKLPECIGKVAVLGYCLGGLMTFLTAVRYGVDAAVVYHGGDTEKYLGEINGFDSPLLTCLSQ
jgi:carboxymethylenebutenolidase